MGNFFTLTWNHAYLIFRRVGVCFKTWSIFSLSSVNLGIDELCSFARFHTKITVWDCLNSREDCLWWEMLPRLIENTWLYLHFCKLKKHSYTYPTLQFPVEMNTRGGKSLDNLYSFHTNYDLQGQRCRTHIFCTILCYDSKNYFNTLHDLKRITFSITYTASYVWVFYTQ